MNSLPISCIRGAEPGIGTGCTEGSIYGKSENGKKALLIGILSTVVLLVAVLGLMLVGCTPEQGADPAPTTVAADAVPTYQLYWNLDRAEYDGKSKAGIYDMTGMSGSVGCKVEAMTYDRVYPVMDLGGNVTHAFLYSRPSFMLTHEGECQHCKEKVTWYEWTRTDTLPSKTGHYQLMADPVDVTQVSYNSDVKICMDLNGHTVNGKMDARIISLHNPGTSLVIMDTSEGQTGRLVGHSVASPQGGVVWVRYGQFHLYSGTLDGSDMIPRLNGTVVQVQKNAYFYMYAGAVIVSPASGSLNADTLAKFSYLNTAYTLAVSDGKIVLAQ